VAPSLRALLKNSIDYTGLLPPADVPVGSAIAAFRSYRSGESNWLLGHFVTTSRFLSQIPAEFDGVLSVVSNCDFTRAASIETKLPVATSRPTYCEVPVESLDEVVRAGSFAKIRTGDAVPESIPSTENVADFIATCAMKRLPFKVTGALQHPMRSIHPLSHRNGGAHALMHGFLNVLLAAAFAWYGEKQDVLESILNEEDADAFRFGEKAKWRDMSLDVNQISSVREHFIHSFGSGSFTEPIDYLHKLNLLT